MDGAQTLTRAGGAQPAPSGAKPTATLRVPGSGAGARIHVEQDGSGVFVYRLVEVSTGRVLAELPRERAGELKDVAEL